GPMNISRTLPHLPWRRFVFVALFVAVAPAFAAAPASHFTLRQVLGYPYPGELTSAASANAIAWTLNERGVRNIWVAKAPAFQPRQVTHYQGDVGQELTWVELSPDGKYVVYVRGGDHDSNWSYKA